MPMKGLVESEWYDAELMSASRLSQLYRLRSYAKRTMGLRRFHCATVCPDSVSLVRCQTAAIIATVGCTFALQRWYDMTVNDP